jgi:hypothetical protein
MVISCKDPEFAVLDAYIPSQRAGTAEIYASHVDIDARLKAALEVVTQDTRNDAAAGDS